LKVASKTWDRSMQIGEIQLTKQKFHTANVPKTKKFMNLEEEKKK
jgi:hypothetical protein